MGANTTISWEETQELYGWLQEAQERREYYKIPQYHYEPRETKYDILDYYQEAYPGRGMKKHLAQDMAQFEGIKEKTVAKRFEKRLESKTSKRLTEKYKAFGATLPPKAILDGYKRGTKQNRLKIRAILWLKVSSEPIARKKGPFTIILDERESKALVQQMISGEEGADIYDIIAEYAAGSSLDPDEVTEASIEILDMAWVE